MKGREGKSHNYLRDNPWPKGLESSHNLKLRSGDPVYVV